MSFDVGRIELSIVTQRVLANPIGVHPRETIETAGCNYSDTRPSVSRRDDIAAAEKLEA